MTLEAPAVVLGGSVAILEDLAPGAKSTVSLKLASFPNGQSLSDKVIGQNFFPGPGFKLMGAKGIKLPSEGPLQVRSSDSSSVLSENRGFVMKTTTFTSRNKFGLLLCVAGLLMFAAPQARA